MIYLCRAVMLMLPEAQHLLWGLCLCGFPEVQFLRSSLVGENGREIQAQSSVVNLQPVLRVYRLQMRLHNNEGN